MLHCCRCAVGLEATPITFEGVPFALMDWVAAFLTTERAKLREAAADRAVGYELGTVQWGRSGDESGSTGAAAPAAMVNYQRKVTPSERAAMLADVLDEVPEGQGARHAVLCAVCCVPCQRRGGRGSRPPAKRCRAAQPTSHCPQSTLTFPFPFLPLAPRTLFTGVQVVTQHPLHP
jgi:hypothetical protein